MKRIVVLTLLLVSCGDSRLSPQGGSITSVQGGNGLTGGGTGGTVTLNIVGATGGGLTVGANDVGLLTSCSSGETLQWNGSAWECGAGGISNSAGNNIIPKSDGTNLVASGLSDSGSSLALTGAYTTVDFSLASDFYGTNISALGNVDVDGFMGVGAGPTSSQRVLISAFDLDATIISSTYTAAITSGDYHGLDIQIPYAMSTTTSTATVHGLNIDIDMTRGDTSDAGGTIYGIRSRLTFTAGDATSPTSYAAYFDNDAGGGSPYALYTDTGAVNFEGATTVDDGLTVTGSGQFNTTLDVTGALTVGGNSTFGNAATDIAAASGIFTAITPTSTIAGFRSGKQSATTVWGFGHDYDTTNFSVNYYNGSAWTEDLFSVTNAGVTTIKTGTSTVTAPSAGTLLALIAADASNNYLTISGTAQNGIRFNNASGAGDGFIAYDNTRRFLWGTAGTVRQEVDADGAFFVGDTSNTAVADNIDIFTIANAGTGQTGADKAVLKITNSGSYNTTSGALETSGITSRVTATRSAGGNNLTTYGAIFSASGSQIPRALMTEQGDVILNASSGSTGIGATTPDAKLHVKAGTASGISTALTGTAMVIEQANGTAAYLQFRSNTVAGLAWGGPSTGGDGKLIYDQSINAMQLATANIFRMAILSTGNIQIGDTSGSAVNDNVDVLSIGNTGTGQTTGDKALLMATNTGSYNTTGGGIIAYGVSSTITATRSAGASALTNIAGSFASSGAQNNYALVTTVGDNQFNTVSGSSTFNSTLSVLGNLTAGDANTDLTTLWGHAKVSGTAPAPTSCGTGPSITGTDMAFRFVTGTSGTACTLTFSRTYTATPVCVWSPAEGTTTMPTCTISATAFTCSATLASNAYNVHCIGNTGSS